MPRTRKGPTEYFTVKRLRRRTFRDVPPVLFHFTQTDRAIKILESGHIRGRPTVSTTENPAIAGPGPVGFALYSKSLNRHGFVLWPVIWGPSYTQEAEWAVASKDSGLFRYTWAGGYGTHVDSERVLIPMSCVMGIFYCYSLRRRPAELLALRRAARRHRVPVRMFDWTQWWGDGIRIPRRFR
jgi:hypothetical protein